MSENDSNDWENDPANWKLGLVYYNNQDPRIFLPKRIPYFGWTLNFARWQSWIFIIIIIAFAYALSQFH